MSPCPLPSSTSTWIESRDEDIDSDRRAPLEASVAERLGCGVGVPGTEVADQDVLAGADTTRNRLSDRSCADEDDDVAHDALISLTLINALIARRSSMAV